MNTNLVVCKDNKVIEAGYKLSLNEQRVILACIAQIDSRCPVSATDRFELSAIEFAQTFGVSKERAYHALSEVTENLFNRYVIIDNPSFDQSLKTLKTRWISSIGYVPNDAKIVIYFSQVMLPYLSELKNQFTRYELKYVSKMTSIYGIRLYELLMQWQSFGKREIEIDELKYQFQIEHLYKDMADLKKRVIEPAVKDINTHSDLTVEWSQRKTGRKVTHLVFKFKPKSNSAKKAKKADSDSVVSTQTQPIKTLSPEKRQEAFKSIHALIASQEFVKQHNSQDKIKEAEAKLNPIEKAWLNLSNKERIHISPPFGMMPADWKPETE